MTYRTDSTNSSCPSYLCANAYRRIASILNSTLQLGKAEKAADDGIAIMEELLEEDPNNREHKAALASLLHRRRGMGFRSVKKRLADAEREAAILEELVEAGSTDYLPQLNKVHGDMVAYLGNDVAQAEAYLQKSMRIAEEHGFSLPPRFLCRLANINQRKGNFDEAEKYYRRGIEGLRPLDDRYTPFPNRPR